jgi:hypothetical protein
MKISVGEKTAFLKRGEILTPSFYFTRLIEGRAQEYEDRWLGIKPEGRLL